MKVEDNVVVEFGDKEIEEILKKVAVHRLSGTVPDIGRRTIFVDRLQVGDRSWIVRLIFSKLKKS